MATRARTLGDSSPGIDAPMCQDTPLDGLVGVLAHAEVCHSTPLPPSTVLLLANARQSLAITEAVQQVEPSVPPALGRPACAVIPHVGQPVGGPTRPTPPPRAPHHPSASYDAVPRKGARATGAKRPAIVAHAATGPAHAAKHRARAGPDRASRPGGPEAPMLFSEICNLIVLGAVHPASDGEYEKVQRVRHVLRRR